MTLTQQQKALVENVIMVVDEKTSKWAHRERRDLEYSILPQAFNRVKQMLNHEKAGDMCSDTYVPTIAEIIGKEVRRARSYKDMAAEEIIKALDAALMILKGNY